MMIADRLRAARRRYGGARTYAALCLSLASAWFAPAASAAPSTGTCGSAASQGVNGPADYATYCWIDFSNYNNATAISTGGQAFVITLAGGSTLSFTLKVSGPALTSTAAPTWTGAALGQSAFITIPGNPALYQTGGAGTTVVTISSIVLTVGSGTVPYALVAADAESTNGGENLSFTTNGNPWTLLANMAYTGSTTFPTLSGTGTATVTETGVNGNVGAYAFATQGSPTTLSASFLGSGLQGVAFAVKFHAVDFTVTSSHTGSFSAGGTGTYTLTTTNNGPDQYAPTDTVTVTDTLPTGETFASASGSGWSCGAVGQVVTCTATNVTVNSGSSLPAIILNVNVASNAPTSLTNTVSVASNPSLDFNLANNTTTDTTTIVVPDLTGSTKSVLNPGGGDYNVGDTVQYTITLNESAGVAAVGASVTDDVPPNLSGFSVVSIPSGATDSSTNTGGANGDGRLNITGITVPANGSVTIVFTAQVASGTADCTTIDNTATVNTANGVNGFAPLAPTVTVAQSRCAGHGSKFLYLYDDTTTATKRTLSRVPQTTNTGTATPIAANNFMDFPLSPVLAAALKFANTPDTGNVTMTVKLIETATGGSAGTSRPTTVELRTAAGTSIATSGSVSVTNGPTLFPYAITVPKDTLISGTNLVLRVHDNNTTRTISVSQKTAAQGSSTVSFNTPTVINVDSVTAYTTTYSTITPPTNGVFIPGQTVFICAVVSDPFGSADTDPLVGGSAPVITLTDPTGATTTGTMTKDGATNCAGVVSAATEAFEYPFPTDFSLATGFWTVTVTATEGTERAPTLTTITHTANGSFDLEVPALLIAKSVAMATDPIEGTTRSKAIPGATATYTIQVQNNGRGPVDSGSLVISDPVPANTVLSLPAKPPFTFTDGATSSGLSIVSGTDTGNITYSNNGGTSYVYTPSCTRPCTDSTITNFKITLTGSMNGKTGGTAPSFTITYNVVIQ
ncbi:MAG TPA: CshA/CshB family fibrillar adhesin-related protein [Gammaproteobacteria bacterium]